MNAVIYLVRHCEAAGQDPDAPLTEPGRKQTIALADRLCEMPILAQRIVSSPFVRAYQSIEPLSERIGLKVEFDGRLIERTLSSVALDDWRERLAQAFFDLDLTFEGGESSRTAMIRGVAVVDQALAQNARATVVEAF